MQYFSFFSKIVSFVYDLITYHCLNQLNMNYTAKKHKVTLDVDQNFFLLLKLQEEENKIILKKKIQKISITSD